MRSAKALSQEMHKYLTVKAATISCSKPRSHRTSTGKKGKEDPLIHMHDLFQESKRASYNENANQQTWIL